MTKRFIIEMDLTHESFAYSPSVRVADRLREIANRLARDSYEALSDGVIRSENFIPSECGTFKIVTT